MCLLLPNTILSTSYEIRNRRNTPGDCFRCADCGRIELTYNAGSCCGNYSTDREGVIRCTPCTNARELASFLDDSGEPFTAYLGANACNVTTWTGFPLGRVLWIKTVRLARRSCFHGSTMLAIRVRDARGRLWFGRSSAGMCVNLRLMKAVA